MISNKIGCETPLSPLADVVHRKQVWNNSRVMLHSMEEEKASCDLVAQSQMWRILRMLGIKISSPSSQGDEMSGPSLSQGHILKISAEFRPFLALEYSEDKTAERNNLVLPCLASHGEDACHTALNLEKRMSHVNIAQERRTR